MGKQWQTLFFFGSKITAFGDCSHEIKRRLLLGRKVMTNLDSMAKSRDITLPTKIHLVKAMVFPVVMCRYESWTIKKAEHRRIDAFELWCWRRLLRVPWIAKRPNHSILKEISPEYALEGLMLSWRSNTLATSCKELIHSKRSWCWERLKAGEGDDRGWDGWMASLTQWTWVWVNSGSWWWTGRPGMLQSMGSQRVGLDWGTELNWTKHKAPLPSWRKKHDYYKREHNHKEWLQKQCCYVLPQSQATPILTDIHQAQHIDTKPLYQLLRPLIIYPNFLLLQQVAHSWIVHYRLAPQSHCREP